MYDVLNLRQIATHELVVTMIAGIADQINAHYAGRTVTVVPVMTGALVFAGHLLPMLKFECLVAPMYVTRYMGAVGTEILSINGDIPDVFGQDVLVIDEIADVGVTLGFVKSKLTGAGELKTCALVERKLKDGPSKVDWVGLTIENQDFLLGSGMDFSGWGRNLPGLWVKP